MSLYLDQLHLTKTLLNNRCLEVEFVFVLILIERWSSAQEETFYLSVFRNQYMYFCCKVLRKIVTAMPEFIKNIYL